MGVKHFHVGEARTGLSNALVNWGHCGKVAAHLASLILIDAFIFVPETSSTTPSVPCVVLENRITVLY